MTDTPATAPAGSPAPEPTATVAAVPAAPRPGQPAMVWIVGGALVGALSVVAGTLALYGQQRIKALEQELVRRQQDSQGQAIEARALAQQAQDTVRAMESKVALLDGRVAETALQRTQLEDLIQQLSRSRDENVLADLDAAVRVAVQQSALTGSAEPMSAALRQAEDRLARMNQPRLERVRRALARDIDRVKAVAVTDVSGLAIKLDEAIRSVDELPLLSQPERRPAANAAAPARAPASSASAAASASAAVASGNDWSAWLGQRWQSVAATVWREVRALVRVTRIDNPESMLVSPDQAWFLRENLKLRLLNARLALLSRQFDTAQGDLREALSALDRYFDKDARRVAVATDLVRQVTGQARQLNLPRPDETLAAIAAAQAGR